MQTLYGSDSPRPPLQKSVGERLPIRHWAPMLSTGNYFLYGGSNQIVLVLDDASTLDEDQLAVGGGAGAAEAEGLRTQVQQLQQQLEAQTSEVAEQKEELESAKEEVPTLARSAPCARGAQACASVASAVALLEGRGRGGGRARFRRRSAQTQPSRKLPRRTARAPPADLAVVEGLPRRPRGPPRRTWRRARRAPRAGTAHGVGR